MYEKIFFLIPEKSSVFYYVAWESLNADTNTEREFGSTFVER